MKLNLLVKDGQIFLIGDGDETKVLAQSNTAYASKKSAMRRAKQIQGLLKDKSLRTLIQYLSSGIGDEGVEGYYVMLTNIWNGNEMMFAGPFGTIGDKDAAEFEKLMYTIMVMHRDFGGNTFEIIAK